MSPAVKPPNTMQQMSGSHAITKRPSSPWITMRRSARVQGRRASRTSNSGRMDDMRLGSARATALLGCVLALLWACVRPVAAHEFSAQALVLQVDRAHGGAVVRISQA